MFVEGVGDLAFFSKTSADHLFIYLFLCLYEMFDSLQFNLQCNLIWLCFVWPIF